MLNKQTNPNDHNHGKIADQWGFLNMLASAEFRSKHFFELLIKTECVSFHIGLVVVIVLLE
jgi:hypothetical protein